MQDWIELEDFTVDAIIGITPAERERAQPVRFDLRMGLDLDPAAGGDLSASVDYAAVEAAVAFLTEHGRWWLIESLAAAIARLLLAPPAPAEERAAIDTVELRIRKPSILWRSTPGLRIERASAWCDLGTRMVPERCWLDTLVEAPRTAAYRVHIEPGASWTLPEGRAAFVLAGTVSRRGARVALGASVVAHDVDVVFSADGDQPGSLLVVGPPLG